MKYPYDIVSFVRKKTFSIEAHFVRGTEDSPMKVFDSTFSRFTATVIADGNAAYFNLPIESLPGMRVKTDIAAHAQFEHVPQVQKDGIDTSDPAFTTRFLTGTLKGKSPADVLIENPGDKGKEILNKQYKWLKSNLDKYPNNQRLMDAIMAASKLDEAKLATINLKPSGVYEILDIGCRPLTRKQREDGKCFVYEGKIMWDTSMDYPVSITVKNYYAEVIHNEDGTLNVNLSSKDQESEVRKEFLVTAEEWLYALDTMEKARDNFKSAYFQEGYQLAEKAAAEARKNAKHS